MAISHDFYFQPAVLAETCYIKPKDGFRRAGMSFS